MLKRAPQLRPLEADDVRWLWAAHRQRPFEFMPRTVDVEQFGTFIEEWTEAVDYDYLLLTRHEHGYRPVGWVLVRGEGRISEPHVQWFPWSTLRERLETALLFLTATARLRKSYIYAHREDKRFFDTLMQWNALQRIGQIPDHFAPKEHAMLYVTPGP